MMPTANSAAPDAANRFAAVAFVSVYFTASRARALSHEVQLPQQRHETRLRAKRVEHRILAEPREQLRVGVICLLKIVYRPRAISDAEIHQRLVERQHAAVGRHLLQR